MTNLIKIYCLRTDQLAELDWDGHTVAAWDCPYCGTISAAESDWHIFNPAEPLINRLEHSSPVGVLKQKPSESPMTTPNIGDKATCQMCGNEIIYVGPYFDHTGELKPRHPATPTGPAYAGQTIPFAEISTRIFRFIAGQITAAQLKDWFAPRFAACPPPAQADIAESIKDLLRTLADPKIKQTLTELLPEEVAMTVKTWSFDDIYAKLKAFQNGELELSDLKVWLAPKITTLPQPVLSSVSVAIEGLAKAATDSETAQALRDLLPALSSPPEGEPPEVLSVAVSDTVKPEDRLG